jgi:hypothetical protein
MPRRMCTQAVPCGPPPPERVEARAGGRVGGRGGLQPPSTAAEVRVHTPTRVSLEEILPGY